MTQAAAVERLRRAKLVVVGGPSGPHGPDELARVQALAGRLELTTAAPHPADRATNAAIRFVPPQRHEMLSTYYRAADVCVVPSRSESFGLVALEAAACGVPVVAAGVGGLTTLVDHGRTGYLVEQPDPEQYARHLTDLLLRPGLAAQAGAAGAARARHYTWSAAAEGLQARIALLESRELVACP